MYILLGIILLKIVSIEQVYFPQQRQNHLPEFFHHDLCEVVSGVQGERRDQCFQP